MASKALATRLDWTKLTQTASKLDCSKLNKLKSQVDLTLAKCSQLPETLPKIDWAYYKAHSCDPKAVEDLEKKYTSLKIEQPTIPTSRIEDLQKAKQQDIERYNKFKEEAVSFIESAEVVKEKFNKMLPIDTMSLEDFTRTFPLWSITYDNPSTWPHHGRAAGLSKEEAAAFEQPDPVPFSTPTAWKYWEIRKKKFYS